MKIFHFSLLWRCNEKCVFCAKGPAPEGARQQFPLREVIAGLGEARKEGCEALSLDEALAAHSRYELTMPAPDREAVFADLGLRLSREGGRHD